MTLDVPISGVEGEDVNSEMCRLRGELVAACAALGPECSLFIQGQVEWTSR